MTFLRKMLLGAAIPAAFAQAPEECSVQHKFTKGNTSGSGLDSSLNPGTEPFTSYLKYSKTYSDLTTYFQPDSFVNNKFCAQMMITMPGFSGNDGIKFMGSLWTFQWDPAESPKSRAQNTTLFTNLYTRFLYNYETNEGGVYRCNSLQDPTDKCTRINQPSGINKQSHMFAYFETYMGTKGDFVAIYSVNKDDEIEKLKSENKSETQKLTAENNHLQALLTTETSKYTKVMKSATVTNNEHLQQKVYAAQEDVIKLEEDNVALRKENLALSKQYHKLKSHDETTTQDIELTSGTSSTASIVGMSIGVMGLATAAYVLNKKTEKSTQGLYLIDEQI